MGMHAIVTAGESRFARMIIDLHKHHVFWQHPEHGRDWAFGRGAMRAVLNDLCDLGLKVPHLRVGWGR